MSKINQLDVKVTFSVGLGNIDVPEKVLQQLKEIEEKGIVLDQSKELDYPDAFEWLNANVHDTDAYEWEYELNELSE